MLAGHEDPREAIAGAYRVLWRRLTRPDPAARRQALVIQEIRLGAARNEGLRPLPRRAREEVEAAWVELLEEASSRYEYAVHPRVLARMLYASWDGVSGDYLTTGDASRASEAAEGFIKALSAMISPRSS